MDGTTLTFGSPFVYESNSTNSNGLAALSSSKFLVAYENGVTEVGEAHIISYAEEVVASNGGGAAAHKRIRDRYREIAAGVENSSDDYSSIDSPTLQEVGIFTSYPLPKQIKTTSPLPTRLVTTGAVGTEEHERITRLHNRVALLKAKSQIVAVAEPEVSEVAEPETTPFQDRVCSRVRKHFSGNAFLRVNSRLQKRFGWKCT